MKILFVSAVLPYPLYSGGQIRIYNLLKRLGEKHEIHLFSFIRSEEEKKYLPELEFCKSVTTVHRGRAWQPRYLFKTLTSSYPFLWSTYHSSQMLSLLSDEVVQGNYDLVHVEPGYVWPSIPTGHRIPIVICEHNIEHEVYQKYVSAFPVSFLKPFLSLDVAKMITWEKRSWNAAAQVVTVSEEDRKGIAGSTVVPNGVDERTFAFRPKKTIAKNPAFLYVGNFRWMENRDAAQHLIRDWWPAIIEKYPGAKLRIVGNNAPLGEYYVGNVKNIQDELYAADIMLAPIRIGGGTKYKILESMAAGLPVISSTTGVKGLDAGDVWTADTPEEVLTRISDMRDDSARRDRLNNARKHIEKEYSWDLIAQKLDHVWNSLS